MIHILFFADLKEAVGLGEVTIAGAGLTIAELKIQLVKDYPLESLDHAMVAVNEEYAEVDRLLASGDTVAFITPVSGG